MSINTEIGEMTKEWREKEQVIQLYKESCDIDISAFITELRKPNI